MTIACLVSLLLGFALGRRLGIRQGFEWGIAYGRLDLRRQSLEKGKCAICMMEVGERGTSVQRERPCVAYGTEWDSHEAASQIEEGTQINVWSYDI